MSSRQRRTQKASRPKRSPGRRNLRSRRQPASLRARRWRTEIGLLVVAGLALGLMLLLITRSAPPNEVAQQAAPEHESRPAAGSVERPLTASPAQLPAPATASAPASNPAPTPDMPAITDNGSGANYFVSLIIDDIGNSEAAGRRAINLPADITFAVLPHTPHGRGLAEQAHRQGKEVMLHMPMSNSAQIPIGPGGLTPDLDAEDFSLRLQQALWDIPHVQGVNNHMGSELTTLQQPMDWLMQQLKQQQLYFIDSFTSADSIAAKVAAAHHIPSARRQVFLDHDINPQDIHFQFQRLLEMARRDGHAIGIGHPYPETLDYLEQALPALADSDIEVVFVSELLRRNGQPSQSGQPGEGSLLAD